MEQKELFELMARFEKSAIHELKLKIGDFSLELEKAPPAPIAPPAAAPSAPVAVAVSTGAAVVETMANTGEFIKAPLVGTYYSAPAPGEAPYAAIGSRIAKGAPICLIEAMKTMNEIPAPCDLIVEELLVADGDLVSFDAPILRYSHV